MKTISGRWLIAACLALALGAGISERGGNAALATAKPASPHNLTQVRQRMSGLEMPFEANVGQQDKRVAFTARTLGSALFVTHTGQLVYSFPGKTVGKGDTRGAFHKRGPGWVLTESLVGARPAVSGKVPSPTRISRFIGNDPKRWQTAIPAFDRVALGEAWPGIAVELAAHGDNVEKLFTVAPGADAQRISIRLDGTTGLELAGDGALVAHTGNGPVSFSAPRAWQDIDGRRKPVRVAYALDGDRYGFRLGGHDPAYPVVIDPLKQSTYLGGSGDDGAHAIAVNMTSGTVYVTGYTFSSADFPVTAGAQQASAAGLMDGFVAAFDNSLTGTPLAVTYLGGSGNDEGRGIALDPAGNVFVAGPTSSANFPVTTGAAQSSFGGGGNDAFVAKFNSNLSLLAATYFGGSGNDVATSIAVDPTLMVFVAGSTTGGLPVSYTSGTVQTSYGGGSDDAFVARFNIDLNNLGSLKATYIGGSAEDQANAIAVDVLGDVFVAGQTKSMVFTGATSGAQSSYSGGEDGFVSRLDQFFSSIITSYLGGSGSDYANGVAVRASDGDVYVVGYTNSTLLPGTNSGVAQPSFAGYQDAFVTRLDPTLTVLPILTTFLGGGADDYGSAIALDAAGNVFVAGMTRSAPFPGVANGAQSTPGGVSYEHFVTRLSGTLASPTTQSTYLGTGQEDEMPSLALDANNYVYVAGRTGSLNFPGRTNGAQAMYGGGAYDAYVSRLTHGLHDPSHATANDDGDPHITTLNGVLYTFQSAGEFTALRDLPGMEIQTRQSPMASWNAYQDTYTGLKTCVSVNTALAARVGTHRVTYEPDFADPSSGVRLRVDGILTVPPPSGLNLSGGGRVVRTSSALEIDFPDGTVVMVPTYQAGSQWVIHIDASRVDAREGIMSAVAPGSWLPALPNGASVGPMPPPTVAGMHQRFVALHQTYANAWRVNNRTSLFDYAPGTSTATFTNSAWPVENATSCVVPQAPPPPKPINPVLAQEICRGLTDKTANANCVFDVAASGRPEFAKGYQLSQRVHDGATTTSVAAASGGHATSIAAAFTATVVRLADGGRGPTGTVEFMLDGKVAGAGRLDEKGIATWRAAPLKPGEHRVSANYLPDKGSMFLPSASVEEDVVIR